MQRGRQIPVLERRAITERAGLVREDREIMPRIVNGAVPTEVALMLPDDLFAATDDDAIGIGTHLHGPARGRRHDRVAVPIKADEAGSGDGVLALMEAVERSEEQTSELQSLMRISY